MKSLKVINVSIESLFLGVALLVVNHANGQTSPPSTEPTADGKAVYSAPVSVGWAMVYPHAAANLSATNANGWNNLQKMMEMLPPDDKSTVVPPISTTSAIRTFSTNAVLSLAQNRQQLHDQADAIRATAAQNQSAFKSRATAVGISRTVNLDGGKVGTLADIDETGHPTYISANDIYAAATTHADQLWPADSVTAVSGWTSGSSGLNLDGSGQVKVIDMFEADYTSGNAGVETDHKQFVDPGTGLPRVTQEDSTGLSRNDSV